MTGATVSPNLATTAVPDAKRRGLPLKAFIVTPPPSEVQTDRTSAPRASAQPYEARSSISVRYLKEVR